MTRAANPNEQDDRWERFAEEVRSGPSQPFEEHWAAFEEIYSGRSLEDGPPRVWRPRAEAMIRSNLGRLMAEEGFRDFRELHRWSVENRADFWGKVLERLGIIFARKPNVTLDPSSDVADPRWLPGARMSCVDSCFKANPDKPAVISGREGTGALEVTTYGELRARVNRIANGLRSRGFREDDGIALYMPMTLECVAAYLGAIRAGCRVVSIADSFSPAELHRRCRLGGSGGLITVEGYWRSGQFIDLYSKVREAGAPGAIVIPAEGVDSAGRARLRSGDCWWKDLVSEETRFEPPAGDPSRITNVLFSSGTTGEPKVIPWTHLTPIKCAMDGHFHHDIHPSDVVAWPTNIGWMMGPWLIFAGLINDAAIALYEGAPTGEGFTRFVRDAHVTILGVIPSLVRAWRSSKAVREREWEHVRVFSSTGEPSNREDYLWLMSLSGYRAPVIEYLGGTEIGGGHITGTVVQPASPATFTTPALGIDFVILDDAGHTVRDGETGELYLIPPSLGLSQKLLNRDHHEAYYEGCPRGPRGETLRRHGDQIARLHGGFFKAQGRSDDTMNLGGIKVSSLELERVIDSHPLVYASAAVGVQPGGEGAEKLVVFAVLGSRSRKVRRERLVRELQERIARDLNPLFKIHELIPVGELPRTASNKLMRRELRAGYLDSARACKT